LIKCSGHLSRKPDANEASGRRVCFGFSFFHGVHWGRSGYNSI
jgi:hypothetical protein